MVLDFNFEDTGERVKTVETEFILNALETKKIWSFPLKKWKKKYDLSKVGVSVYVYDVGNTLVFSDFVSFRKLLIEEI
ncbi:MAG: hypothetical protein IPO32_11765 [Crocinitomicaceae bacterium]|nr:hypothetical protein [Crocinitomicaceae bacterium]